MKLKLLALIVGIFSLTTPATHAFFGGNPAAFTDEALFLDIQKEGFQALGEIAQEQLLSNIEDQTLKDMKLDIPLIAKINVNKISFSANFEKLKIVPENDGLYLDLAIRNLSINVGEVRVANWFLPSIGTSCHNTKITFGNGGLIPVRARLGLKVVNGSIQLRDRGVKFHIKPDQYVTSGPSNCVGAFGMTDHIAEFLVRNVIASARPTINMAVKLGVGVLSSQIGDLLFTQIDKVRIPVTIPNILITPETKIKLGLRVNALKLTNDKMRLVLGVAVEKDFDKGLVERELPPLIKYGTIGINPVFINKLISVVMPKEGTTPVEITPDFHEMVGQILKTSEFANFIPDLETVEVDTEQLKMFLTFLKPINLAIVGNSLDASLEGLQLKLQVKKDEKWMDYFFINVGTNLNLKGGMAEGKIKLIPTVSDLKIDGNFAAGYTPKDPTFLVDELRETFQVILEIFTEGDDGLAIDVPFITLGTRKVGFDKLEIKAPYLFLDIVGMNLAE